MASAADKARNARIRTKEVGSAARDTARNNASAAGVKLTSREERTAADRMRPTISAERERTAGRATSAAKREDAKASESRVASATGLDRIVAINQQRVSPLGVQQRDIQIKKSQAALQKSRIKIVNGTKYYDSSGTN